MAPTQFCHGLWTAILGGALFATAARSREPPRPDVPRYRVAAYVLDREYEELLRH